MRSRQHQIAHKHGTTSGRWRPSRAAGSTVRGPATRPSSALKALLTEPGGRDGPPTVELSGAETRERAFDAVVVLLGAAGAPAPGC
jgi:hypothetical protein